MMEKYTFLSRVHVFSSFSSVIDELYRACSEPIVMRMADGSYTSSYNPAAALKKYNSSGVEKVFVDIVRETCLRIESRAPGSTFIVLCLLKGMLACHEKYDMVRTDIEKIIDNIEDYIVDTDKDMLSELVLSLTSHDEFLAGVVFEAVMLAGIEGKIFLEKSLTGETFIEKKDGYNFIINPNPKFYKNGSWMQSNVKVLLVDGIIQNVAEIDHLLQQANDKNIPIALFARGFGDEVMATLHVNFLRGTLKVIPIVVGFDVATANVLNDLSVVIGTDVISSLKGELISTVSFENLGCVDEIKCRGKNVKIRNDVNQVRLITHLNDLRARRENETINEIKAAFDARIKSLSASTVYVRLGNDCMLNFESATQRIDAALRSLQPALYHGVIDSATIAEDDNNNDATAAIFRGMKKAILPASSMVAALKTGVSIFDNFLSTAVLLKLDLEPNASL